MSEPFVLSVTHFFTMCLLRERYRDFFISNFVHDMDAKNWGDCELHYVLTYISVHGTPEA